MNNPTTLSNRYVYSAMLICILMMPSMLWMPSMLGALAQGYGLSTGALSRLASFETIGFLAGTLFTSSKTLPELKRWLFVGVALLIGVNVLLVLFVPQVPFIALRPIAGVGSGLGFGYALKVCAMSVHPTRSFGLLTGLMSSTMIAGFQGMAFLIARQTDGDGHIAVETMQGIVANVLGIYALFPAVALLIYLANRPPVFHVIGEVLNDGVTPLKATGLPSPRVLIGLSAIVISFMGQGGVWAFLQVMGTTHGFSVSGIANAMSTFAIVGVIGSFSAAGLPHRVPRWVAMAVALFMLSFGLYALYMPQNIWWYIAGCAAGGFYWNFILPLILGILARIDHTGRGSVLGGSMSSLGAATGPLIAGLLIHGSDYHLVGWMAGAFCLIGFICVWFVETRSTEEQVAEVLIT